VAERLAMLSDPDLELALFDLGARLDFPPEPDLAEAVRSRIEVEPARRRIRPWTVLRGALERAVPSRPIRRAVALGIAFLLLLATAAVAGRLGVPGLKIIFRPGPAPSVTATPSLIGNDLFLGKPSTLADARTEVRFPVAVPHAGGLPEPEVYVRASPPGGEVSLVYRAGPGMPKARFTGVGLLLTEFDGSVNPQYLQKIVFRNVKVHAVVVNGEPGYWITGHPHEVILVDRNGNPFPNNTRLAGNTLVWQRGTLTIRMEGRLTLARALVIARSVR